MSCFTGNYKESDFRRDLTFEENMEPYPLSMVGAFDVVLSLNSEIVDSCGEFYFEKKLKDEVRKNTYAHMYLVFMYLYSMTMLHFTGSTSG